MEVDQSALTGESFPAERKSGDAVFSGSIIRQGEIDALAWFLVNDLIKLLAYRVFDPNAAPLLAKHPEGI